MVHRGPNAPDGTFYLHVSLRLLLRSVFSTPVDHTNDVMSTASSVMLVSGANLNPTASTSALASTHIIVFKHLLQADAMDIAQIGSCRLDGVSEWLPSSASLYARTPWYGIVRVRYSSEASVTVKREGG